MLFTITPHKEVSLKKAQLRWRIGRQRVQRAQELYFMFGAALLLISVYWIIDQVNFGYISIAGALYLLIGSCSYLLRSNKERIEFLEKVNKRANKCIQSGEPVVYEFTEAYFRQSDFLADIRINWDAIQSAVLINDMLFLRLDELANAYVISKEEIGEENMQAIYSFAQSKIQKA